MPELPEVETIRSGLAAQLRGAAIVDLQLYRANLRYDFPVNFKQNILNARILEIERRAKYLLFRLSNKYSIISHLGMSGSWVIQSVNQERKKHDHIVMNLQIGDNSELLSLTYNDPRRFGFVFCEKDENIEQHSSLRNLGIEPLTLNLNAQNLYEKLLKKKTNFKTALLDQTIIAGLGNIYVCEALWRSGISPFDNVHVFCVQQEQVLEKLAALCKNIKEVLQQALEAGGSSLRDYKNASGKAGAFQNNFAVYNRASLPCPKCGLPIQRAVQNGRSSFYCENCQPRMKKEI